MNNNTLVTKQNTSRVRLILMLGLIVCCIILTACENGNVLPAEQSIDILPTPHTPVRIAILTEPFGWGGVGWESYSANWLREIHGAEKIYHNTTWGGSRSSMALTAESIINDPEIKVVIVNSARRGVNYFVSKIREQRSDIFIVYIDYDSDGHCDYPYIFQTFSEGVAMADLILNIDMLEMYRNLPAQAQSLGAETLVFFYIADWDDKNCWAAEFYFSYERELMRAMSEEIGLRFVAVPRGQWCIQCGGSFHMYLKDNVQPLIDKYGKDIAFVGLGGARILAMSTMEGVIYLSSYMQSSPARLAFDMRDYMLVPTSLCGMENDALSNKNNLAFIIEELRATLDEYEMLGRVSTWPVSASTLLTYAAVEYGIKWINSDVPQDNVDLKILQQIMVDFIAKYYGEHGLGVNLTQRVHDGNIYTNYVLIFMDFMTY